MESTLIYTWFLSTWRLIYTQVGLSKLQMETYFIYTKIEVCRSNQLKTVHNYYVLYQILITLQYIHSKDIIHRDIKVERFTSDCFLKNLFKKKPSNILINQDCQIKLADFGLARGIFCKQTQRYACDLTSYVATRWYATQ